MLYFKSAFSLSSFTFKRLFSYSSLSVRRVVSSAYLRLLIFLPAILIPACASSSSAFHIPDHWIIQDALPTCKVPSAIQGNRVTGSRDKKVDISGVITQPTTCGDRCTLASTPKGLDPQAGRSQAGQSRLRVSCIQRKGPRGAGGGGRRARAGRPQAFCPGLALVGAPTTASFLEEQNYF